MIEMDFIRVVVVVILVLLQSWHAMHVPITITSLSPFRRRLLTGIRVKDVNIFIFFVNFRLLYRGRITVRAVVVGVVHAIMINVLDDQLFLINGLTLIASVDNLNLLNDFRLDSVTLIAMVGVRLGVGMLGMERRAVVVWVELRILILT